MIEVNLVKRLITLGVVVFVALGVLACTREKPMDVPTPMAVSVATAPTATKPLVMSTGTPLPLGTPSTPLPLGTPSTPLPPPTLPTLSAPTIPVTVTTPTATPTLVATPVPPPGTATTYKVQWGDWLRKIAEKHGVTVEALIAANPGINPNVIYPGQTLNIPAPGSTPATPSGSVTEPTTYTVQRGEWLSQIARKFGVSVPQLLAANPGINPNVLYPGQVLRIPAKATPVPGDGTPTPSAGGSTTYTVRAGDTLYAIAVRFKTTPLALQIANNLANPNAIYPGMVLIIPAQ
jgi:LysM repeat protein